MADRFATLLDGMRETVAVEGTKKGLAQALQAAILNLLERIVALLAQFQTAMPGAAVQRPRAAAATGPPP